MPSKKQYDLVQNDDYDIRIPLHPEEAFHHGIAFQAKFIGLLDVPRPTSRVEIVAAMRRIRYEFKAKGIKKKKVTLEVSVDGVKVTLRKKKKRRHWNDDKNILLQHPIYRIFYVSHDSQDLKIFSYIARDGASNVFKCAVFKANKKSQAMRVVRTIGQAFEVCHKLSITAPEQDTFDQDEQETLTQDLLSDRFSDVASEKPKKDHISEGASDKMSLPPDDCSIKEEYIENPKQRPPQFDILPPPPANNNIRRTPFMAAETYAAPHSDILGNNTGGGGSTGSGSGSIPPSGTTLSSHHELQLMREQLEQQNQQTQAAIAQLQLAQEQLAAEQSARMEAQARTHQLLVHNRELLDHIAALVAHLQGGDKMGQQATPPHMTMPQQPFQGESQFNNQEKDLGAILQALGLNPQGLIENRSATCLPSSPLRNSYGLNFTYPPHPPEASMESQLLQRLLLPTFPMNLHSSLPYLAQSLVSQALMNNNNYSPTQNNFPTTPYATLPRQSTNIDHGKILSRHSEPRQIPSVQYQQSHFCQSPQQDALSTQVPPQLSIPAIRRNASSQELYQKPTYNSNPQKLICGQRLHEGVETRQHKDVSPQSTDKDTQFIKPLSQMGTMTTTDGEGKVKVIVPVPSTSIDEADDILSNLRIKDEIRLLNGPGITRSSSERVPNRSELMSQVTRTAWARHTTK